MDGAISNTLADIGGAISGIPQFLKKNLHLTNDSYVLDPSTGQPIKKAQVEKALSETPAATMVPGPAPAPLPDAAPAAANAAPYDPQAGPPTLDSSSVPLLRQSAPVVAPNPDAAALAEAKQPANYLQLTNESSGTGPAALGGLSKLGKLLFLGQHLAQGAIVGSTQRGLGAGFEAAQQEENRENLTRQALTKGGLENQMTQAQIRLMPWTMQMKMRQQQAELEATHSKSILDQAQANAARFKEDPNLGLVDTLTGKPISGDAGFAPLTDNEAEILGKNPGDRVPIKTKNTANEMVNRGIKNVQAGGRSLLVDGQGNTIKDMGESTPIVMFGKTQGPYANPVDAAGNVNPKLVDSIDKVGQYGVKLSEMLTRVAPASRAGFMTALHVKYPNYDENTYDTKHEVMQEYASTKPGTAGAQALAFNTAMAHLGLLSDATDALKNHDLTLFNRLAQTYKDETGSPVGATFDLITQAVSGELTKLTGSLSQGEQEAIKASLSREHSPDALHSAIGSAIKIMDGKMSALEFHRDNQLGFPGKALISPEAKAARDRLLGGAVSRPSSQKGSYAPGFTPLS